MASAEITQGSFFWYDHQLLKAARQWRYRPAMKGNHAVRYRRVIELPAENGTRSRTAESPGSTAVACSNGDCRADPEERICPWSLRSAMHCLRRERLVGGECLQGLAFAAAVPRETVRTPRALLSRPSSDRRLVPVKVCESIARPCRRTNPGLCAKADGKWRIFIQRSACQRMNSTSAAATCSVRTTAVVPS